MGLTNWQTIASPLRTCTREAPSALYHLTATQLTSVVLTATQSKLLKSIMQQSAGGVVSTQTAGFLTLNWQIYSPSFTTGWLLHSSMQRKIIQPDSVFVALCYQIKYGQLAFVFFVFFFFGVNYNCTTSVHKSIWNQWLKLQCSLSCHLSSVSQWHLATVKV